METKPSSGQLLEQKHMMESPELERAFARLAPRTKPEDKK